MIRYFRSTETVYESVRAQLDAAYAYPNRETLTDTAIPPASSSPRDAAGLVYLAVPADYCDFILPAQMLADMIASGDVEEVNADTFMSVASHGQ